MTTAYEKETLFIKTPQEEFLPGASFTKIDAQSQYSIQGMDK